MFGQEVIANGLEREGVEYLFTFPSTPIIQGAREVGIQPIICRQERVGVNMADGYSRVTNGERIGVFASQYGPGAENAFPGVATAYADSSPVLYLARGYEQDRAEIEPYFSVRESFEPITKWVEYLTEPAQTGGVFQRAFSYLRNGRPQPVAIEIPDDVLSADFEPAFYDHSIQSSRSAGDASSVEAAVTALLAAENPVIHAGQGVLYAGATPGLIEIAELLDIPVMTTLAGKSAFPEDHDLALGTGARSVSGPVRELLPEADVVLGIGTSFTKHGMTLTVPGDVILIHATNDPIDINKSYEVEYPIVGDAELVLNQLVEEAIEQRGTSEQRDRGCGERVTTIREAWLDDWMPTLTSDETPITPFRVIWEFMQTIDPSDAIVTHDSGSPRDQLVPFYQATEPRGYLGWGKSHSLGTGLGLIMGAKLAKPEKFCVNFMGDAAFGMVGLDFETAVRYEIPILTVVLNNNAMAGYDDRLGNERYLGGNYAALAESLGGKAVQITEPDALAGAFETAQEFTEEAEQPMLIEVKTSEETGHHELLGL